MTYTQEDFDRLISELWQGSGALLKSKGAEYASNEERLGNFKRIATASGVSPERVAFIFLQKHVDSIGQSLDMPLTFEWETDSGREGLKQRVADAMNYLLLLSACLEARTSGR